MTRKVYPGKPFPLGATWSEEGVNFALYSENATGVELCLLNRRTEERIPLTEHSEHIWHICIPGIQPGQLYGYRVSGPWEPENGHRFHPAKLLLDPYAKAIYGDVDWCGALFSYKPDNEDSLNDEDSAPCMPKSVVVGSGFNWEGDRRLLTPMHKTVLYELHVKGFSQLNERIPEELRGTYAGLAHQESVRYLKELGVTAVELMPVHFFTDDKYLLDKGLSNYWGYNTIGFFAPASRYAATKDPAAIVDEFRTMVKELHKAGIEVILDVVYNHTAEGNHLGPTLCFKGLDNSVYYRLKDDKRYYNDYTGTGNTLNARMPAVQRMIMDSLRYWVLEMHVDGFRFDLASTLARELHEVDRLSGFLDIIYQDPVISQVKLIAEPWDVGEGGYQVGNFPPGWSEWNGKYRDCMRDYWRGADSMLGEFAARFTGSADLYEDNSRKPTASINFITAHDGFTLHDLVSYNDKHNEANGEENRDGESNNRSWNCGAEGTTDDEVVLQLRHKQRRNLLTTLFLSQGVPMLIAGDEMGKTQNGNNNAYCQDNDISWLNWQNGDGELLEFTKKLIHLTRSHPVFCRRGWFKGQRIHGEGVEDIAWFRPDGSMMNDEDWSNGFAKSLGVFLNGGSLRTPDEKGEKILDDSFYLLFNAHHEPVGFTLPPERYGAQWVAEIDTANPSSKTSSAAGQNLQISDRSLMVLRKIK